MESQGVSGVIKSGTPCWEDFKRIPRTVSECIRGFHSENPSEMGSDSFRRDVRGFSGVLGGFLWDLRGVYGDLGLFRGISGNLLELHGVFQRCSEGYRCFRGVFEGLRDVTED